MNIMDIYNMMTSYVSSSPEHMYIWLSQYSISDQLIFIKLFSSDKIKLISKQNSSSFQYRNKHSPNNCKCQKIFDTLDDNFKNHISLENIYKCVDTVNAPPMDIPTIGLDSNKVYTFGMKQQDESLLIKYTSTNVIIHSSKEHENILTKNIVNDDKFLLDCNREYLLKGKNNFSLPISIIFNKLHNLQNILPYPCEYCSPIERWRAD